MEQYFDFRLKSGSSMLLCGPTMAGKSTFVHKLLADKTIFDTPPDAVFWYYGGESPKDLEGKGYKLHAGLPDSFQDIPPNSVIVLDDLMDEAKDHPGVTALFTKLVHHKKLFVINISQNFFVNSKHTRTRRLNTQYIVMFKNPSDVTQIHMIGRQMYPGNPRFLASVNAKATKRPHSYLFLDLRQETPDDFRVRSRILPDELPMKMYKQELVKKAKSLQHTADG